MYNWQHEWTYAAFYRDPHVARFGQGGPETPEGELL